MLCPMHHSNLLDQILLEKADNSTLDKILSLCLFPPHEGSSVPEIEPDFLYYDSDWSYVDIPTQMWREWSLKAFDNCQKCYLALSRFVWEKNAKGQLGDMVIL